MRGRPKGGLLPLDKRNPSPPRTGILPGDLLEAQALARDGHLEEALHLLRTRSDLVRRAPSLEVRLLNSLGRREEALGCLRRLASACTEPADALSLCHLAELAVESDASDLALDLLRRGEALAPGSPPLVRSRFRLLQRLGRTSAAQALLEGVAVPAPSWAVHERAAACARAGRQDEAMALWASFDDAYGHHQRAEILWRAGRAEEARAEERRALRCDPGYLWAHWRLLLDEASREPEAVPDLLRDLPEAVRHGLGGLPAVLLERAGRAGEADRWRLAGFGEPLRSWYSRRLAEVRSGSCEWHPPSAPELVSGVRLLLVPLGGVLSASDAVRLGSDVVSFVTRELPGTSWSAGVAPRPGSHGYPELEGLVRHGNRKALARELRLRVPGEDEACLVLLGGPTPFGASRGFGGHRTAAVQLAPGDPWSATVAAHELFHAVAGLRHPDGEKAEWEPLSLMGYPGAMVPLDQAWLDLRQLCWMASPPGTSERVEAGRAAEERRNWSRAAREYRGALDRDPLHLWVRGRLVRVLLRCERVDEALEVLAEGRSIDRGCELASFHGELLAHLGRLPEARRELARSLGVGRSSRAHVALGMAWGRSARYPLALGEYHRAGGLDPADPEPWFHQASAHHALGHLGQAERLYRRALGRQPRWGEVLRRLALLCAEQEREEEAREFLRRARPLQEGSPEQAWFEGRVAWLLGDVDRALARLERSRALAPREQSPHHALGWARLSLGDLPAAARRFRACRELFPQSFLGQAAQVLQRAATGAPAPTLDPLAAALLRQDPRHAPLVLVRWRAAGQGTSRARRAEARLRQLEPRHPLLPARK